MPINPSPSYHGYHITNYYDVNHDYGTMNDFKRLLDEAHKRDIKTINDFVINHTSTQHPWIQSALKSGSQYRDWYIWSDRDPGTRFLGINKSGIGLPTVNILIHSSQTPKSPT